MVWSRGWGGGGQGGGRVGMVAVKVVGVVNQRDSGHEGQEWWGQG